MAKANHFKNYSKDLTESIGNIDKLLEWTRKLVQVLEQSNKYLNEYQDYRSSQLEECKGRTWSEFIRFVGMYDSPTWASGLEDAEVVKFDMKRRVIRIKVDSMVWAAFQFHRDQLSELASRFSGVPGEFKFFVQSKERNG